MFIAKVSSIIMASFSLLFFSSSGEKRNLYHQRRWAFTVRIVCLVASSRRTLSTLLHPCLFTA